MPRGETSVQVLETAELVLVLILEQAIHQPVCCLSRPPLLTHARLSQEPSGCCCEWRPPVSTAVGVLGLVSLRLRADGLLVQRPLNDEAALATQADVSLRRFLVASQPSAASRFFVPRTAPIIRIVREDHRHGPLHREKTRNGDDIPRDQPARRRRGHGMRWIS